MAHAYVGSQHVRAKINMRQAGQEVQDDDKMNEKEPRQ
jgi:hypothetical protein